HNRRPSTRWRGSDGPRFVPGGHRRIVRFEWNRGRKWPDVPDRRSVPETAALRREWSRRKMLCVYADLRPKHNSPFKKLAAQGATHQIIIHLSAIFEKPPVLQVPRVIAGSLAELPCGGRKAVFIQASKTDGATCGRLEI